MNAALLVMRQHILALATDTNIHKHHGDRAMVISCGRAFAAIMSVSKTTLRALDISNDNRTRTDLELKNMVHEIARPWRNEFVLDWLTRGQGFLCPICRTLQDGEEVKKCKKPRLHVRNWSTLCKHVGISHGWDVVENVLGECMRLRTRLCRWNVVRRKRKATAGCRSAQLEAELQVILNAMRQAGVLLGQDARQADDALEALEGEELATVANLLATARFLRVVPM